MSSMRRRGSGPTVGMNSSVVPAMVPEGPGQGHELARTAAERGHRSAVAVRVALAEDEEKPERPAGQRLLDQADHGRDLLRRWPGPGGVVAHDDPAHGRVADQEAGVDGEAAVDPVQVLAEGVPVPGAGALHGASSGMPSTTAIIRWM